MRPTAASLLRRASLRLRKGDRSAALAALDRAIALDPSFASAFFARGDLKRTAGDPNGAIKDLTTAVRLDPTLALAFVSRGNARRNNGALQAALADFNEAIRLNPSCEEAYTGRGMTRSQAGDPHATKDFDIAIRLAPSSPEAYFGRGWARLSAGDADGAVSDLNKAVRRDPSHGFAFMLRGQAQSLKGHTARAIVDFTQALQLGIPDPELVHGKRGVQRLRKGDLLGALSDLTKALECQRSRSSTVKAADRKLGALYLSRGTALAGLGQHARAIADLTTAARMDPSLQRLARPVIHKAQQALTAARHSGKDYGAALEQWEVVFRTEANADNLAGFRQVLEHLGLKNFSPTQLLEGTIELVRSSLLYYTGLDGRPFLPFLSLQTYNPAAAPAAQYALVFNIHNQGIARLLDTESLEHVDLADLLGHPFEDQQVRGFSDLWILQADYSPLAASEPKRIKQHVREDLYFDYGRDELKVRIRTQQRDHVLVQPQVIDPD